MTDNKYEILMVEDEVNIQAVIRIMLETSDYSVVAAGTCASAI